MTPTDQIAAMRQAADDAHRHVYDILTVAYTLLNRVTDIRAAADELERENDDGTI